MIIKTTDLLDEVQLALAGEPTEEVEQFCNTLLFWLTLHLKERYIVLTDRQARMRRVIKGDLA